MPVSVSRTTGTAATVVWEPADDPEGRIAQTLDAGLAEALTALGVPAADLASVDQFERAKILRAAAALHAELTRRIRYMTVIARNVDGMTWGTLASTLTGSSHARSTARSTYDAGMRQLRATVHVVCRRDDGYVLAVRRGEEPDARWTLPGGHVGPCDSPLVAAARELETETGVQVAPPALMEAGVWSTPGRDPNAVDNTTAYYTRVPAHTVATAGDGAAEVRWLPLDETYVLVPTHDEIVASTRRFS
ncbi:NUDIX domain-containing protein [Streptomyces sp. CA-181903]|uniref:NUDIX domain-containing protein n=1 Tax=Streptomyces sp. CA-181903 TaxID=3240055 RepID=UPI003D9417B7